jgi:hypothetical protein
LPKAGLTVSVVEAVLAEVAVIVAVAGNETVDAETGNVPTICPAGIVMDAGTLTAGLLLARFTFTPAAGAAEASVTVPAALSPLVTGDGDTERLAIVPGVPDWLPEAGLTVSVVEAVLPEVAVIVAAVGDETAEAETGNVPVVCPAGMVTEAGTVAAGLLLARPTSTPFEGAAEDSVTVPVAD